MKKDPLCYSSYRMEQDLGLSLNVGLSMSDQRSKMNANLHVRKLSLPVNKLEQLAMDHPGVKIESYLFRIDVERATVDGVQHEVASRYRHPFIIYRRIDTGAVLELQSTQMDNEILDEYYSIADVFQYSSEPGKIRYRDGNGLYEAKNSLDALRPGYLKKTNLGYLGNTQSKQPVIEVVNDQTSLRLSNDSSHCFFSQANSVKKIETVLSKISMVEVTGSVDIILDTDRVLPRSDNFFTLNTDLALWPKFNDDVHMSEEQALAKIPYLVSLLSASIDNDAQFLATLQSEVDIWSQLPVYLESAKISDALSKQLHWALGRIDTPESVSVLTKLIGARLGRPHDFRAIMALASTSAKMDTQSAEFVSTHTLEIGAKQHPDTTELTFVRMVGAMADHRHSTDEIVSKQLKDLLYTYAGSSSEKMNSAIIGAIGNLGESIDQQGTKLLIDGLTEASSIIRQSAASALSRIPYDLINSEVLVHSLRTEKNIQISETLIGAMSGAEPADDIIKNELVLLVSNPRLASAAVESLEHINFDLNITEVQQLEHRLRLQNNSNVARGLAKLILKNRKR